MKHLFFPCLIVLSLTGRSPGGDKPRKEIRFSDRFAENTLKDYKVEGKVTWEKGKVTLRSGALTRAIDLGPRAEVRVVVRRPKDREKINFGVSVLGRRPPDALIYYGTGRISGAVDVFISEGKAELINMAGEASLSDGAIKYDYSEQVTVRADKKKGAEDWVVRVETCHGVLRAKVWPAESAEPKAWQTTRFSGEAFWETGKIRIACGQEPCVLLALDIIGGPPTPPLSPERQKKADRAAALNREDTNQWRQIDPKTLAQAIARSREALKLSQEAYGKDHPACALVLGNLGTYHEKLGKLEEAVRHDEAGLAIARMFFGPDHYNTSVFLTKLGLRKWRMGRYREARQFYDESLRIRLLMLGSEHPDTTENWINLGVLFIATGEHSLGRRYIAQALAVRRKTLGEHHWRTAEALNNLATACSAIGDYAAARKYFEQCLAIATKVLGPKHIHTLQTQHNLVNVLSAMGDEVGARKAYEQLLEDLKTVVPEDHPLVALISGSLGMTLRRLKDPGAVSYFERAQAIYKKRKLEKHPEMANILTGLGYALQDQGQWERGRRHFEQALALRREVLPAGHPDTAWSLLSLSTHFAEKGERAVAIRHAKEALAICNKALGDHRLTAGLLQQLFIFEAMEGNDPKAWDYLQASTAMRAGLMQRSLAASAERDHAALAKDGRLGFSLLLGYAEARPALGRAHALQLAEAMLDWKAAGERTLTLRREAVAIGKNPKALAAYEDLKIVRHLLVQAMMRGPGNSPIPKHRQLLEALQARQDSLERQLADQLDDFARLLKERQLGLKAVAAQLKPTAALVGMVRYPHFNPQTRLLGQDRYAALILQSQSGQPKVQLIFLGDADPIDRAIHVWRAAVQQGRVDAQLEKDLRQRVWEPLAKSLPDKTDRLFLIPEAGFALLPFEAIRLADGAYLVERLQISYLASGRELLAVPKPRDKGGLALVVADPDFEAVAKPAGRPYAPDQGLQRRTTGPAAKFQSLPGFAREADAVARRLRGQAGWKVNSLRRDKATEEGLAAVTRPRLLYVVTHGFFLSDLGRPSAQERLRDLELVTTAPGPRRLPPLDADPRLRSGLALTGANRWQKRLDDGLSDGWLTALEVENLDLWGTDLVVLSACDTGRGEIQIGEGVLGLRRAFQMAGARTVLASLWKVPDADTERLMAHFLAGWLRGDDKAAALRQAQLAMIRALRTSRDPHLREAPPLFWAGFICHGQAR